MRTTLRKNKIKQITIEQIAGDGPMMVFSGVRSELDLQFMSEWVVKRKVDISASPLDSNKIK